MDPTLLAELAALRAAKQTPVETAPAETGALQSFYGAGNEKRARTRRKAVPDASTALAGCAGAADREQTVLTPTWLVQRLIELTGPLGLDPCTTQENPLGARVWCTGPGGIDGLAVPWVATASLGFTYVNPPFNDLDAWLTKAAREGQAGCPIWFLGPFRPQRAWFGPNLVEPQVHSLAPIKFVGHTSGFPAPLFVAGWNVPPLTSLRDDSKTKKQPLGREYRLGRWRFEP